MVEGCGVRRQLRGGSQGAELSPGQSVNPGAHPRDQPPTTPACLQWSPTRGLIHSLGDAAHDLVTPPLSIVV